MSLGSSTGLGRAIALKTAAENSRLVVCADLTPEAPVGNGTEADIPTHELIDQRMGGTSKRAIFVRTDVGMEMDMDARMKEVTKTTGRLVCNVIDSLYFLHIRLRSLGW